MGRIVRCSLVVGMMFGVSGFANADDQAELRGLIDKAIKAKGGEAKLTKYKAATMTLQGKFHGLGNPVDYTGEIVYQLPTQMKFAIEIDVMGQKFKVIQVLNGDKGWMKQPDKEGELDKEQLAEAKEGLYAHGVESLLPLKDKAYQLAPLGETKVSDRPALGVRVSHKDQRDVNLYFDKENGLLLKSERTVKDEMAGGKEVMQESLFSDYKDTEGGLMPMKLVVKRDGKLHVEGETKDVKFEEKLDDSVFGKP